MLEGDGPKVLVASKLDRLSRSALDFLTLVKRAQDHGWSLVVLEFNGGSLDMTTPMGRFTSTLFAVLAEPEREMIPERTKAALGQARKRGVRLGRLVATPEPVRQRIVQEREAGKSMAAIAETLNEAGVPTARGGRRWHASTVRAVLDSMRRDEEARAAANGPVM